MKWLFLEEDENSGEHKGGFFLIVEAIHIRKKKDYPPPSGRKDFFTLKKGGLSWL